MTEKQSNELLSRACEIITSMEGWILEGSDYYNSDLAKSVDSLFNEVDMLNFHPPTDVVELERATPYEQYVANVKQNIDQATEEGILKDDCSEGYSYLSEETWLRMQADQEAQDGEVFGENKI
tara:strand:+ start:22 stop:390 length:369 start_codon:yes stop_codon:yes gene_type:complete